jgi:PhnB protein
LARTDVRGRERTRSNRARPVPDGWHTVTPRIFADDAGDLVAFVKEVFGASGEYRDARPTELKIGDSIVMIADASARGPAPAFLYVYVADADATYQRALDAGATSIEAPSDMPYGDRRGMVEDRWGNVWQIATHRGRPLRRRPAPGRRRASRDVRARR